MQNVYISTVRATFAFDLPTRVRETWEEWARVWAPRTDSAEDYILQLSSNNVPFHCPLESQLLNPN
jgi:hypothetical protein